MIISPTALQKDGLEARYKALQAEYQAITAKLTYSDSAEAVRLQLEADYKIKELQQLNQQIRELEQQLEAENQPRAISVPDQQAADPPQVTAKSLFDLLLQIDFKEQSELLRQAIRTHRASGFLVHGSPECDAQQVLVTRLCLLNHKLRGIQPIRIDVSHHSIGANLPKLWSHLAPNVGLPKMRTVSDTSEIIAAICDRLKTQHVVFVFHKVETMPPDRLKDWLQQFWEPLVAEIRATPALMNGENRLLMFLVDYRGIVCQSDLRLATQHQQPDYPRAPLKLPGVDRFPADALEEWLDCAITAATPRPLAEKLSDLTVEMLLEQTENGVPQWVYEEICQRCECNWEGEMTQWLI